MIVVMVTDPATHGIRRFKCPGCNLVVQGTQFSIQLWADEHCFQCFEDRAKVHLLDRKGRIDVAG